VWHQRTINYGVVGKQSNNYLALGHTLLLQILRKIARTTLGIKYKILTCDTLNDNVKIFKSITWVYGPYIVAFKHLRQ
jgi:NADPH-dependent 7-cyano-7-deazaguanine reductase QueF-like protein